MLVTSKKLLAASVFFVLIACSESLETEVSEPVVITTTTTVAPTTTIAPDLETVVGRLSLDWDGNWFMGQLPVKAVKADSDLDPVLVGLINMENSPAGSFPEARVAIEAAADWVNSELGGINGRPIELVTCITDFSIEKSQSCAQEMVMAGVVAVTTGIDMGSN